MAFQPQPFKFTKDLNGISLKSLEAHYKLYEGYINKTNEIQEKIVGADKSEANATYSLIGELKREHTFATNGMRLHEIYFGHLGGDGGDPSGTISEMIQKDFGSLATWKEDFIAGGMSARGWSILAFDWHDKKLYNYTTDTQNFGPVWNCLPLLAMDVYEHAYFMDYGTNRKGYIEAFFRNIDWDFVNKLIPDHIK